MKLSKAFIFVVLIISLSSIQTRRQMTMSSGNAQSYVQFARLPYCDVQRISKPQHVDCDVCEKTRQVGSTIERIYTYDKIINNYSVRFNMVISKGAFEKLVISFGGPKTENLFHIQDLYRNGFININNNKIEKGFWDIYDGEIRRDLTSRLRHRDYYDLVFVGHSVGGSLAVIAAYDVSMSNMSLPKPHVYVYGALTVGDQNFSNHIKDISEIVRIKKSQDLYTQFPYCLLTNSYSSTCYGDYSTLYQRYPFYRPYLNGVYPNFGGRGYWPSMNYYSGYGSYYPYGIRTGGYFPYYGGRYSLYPNFPSLGLGLPRPGPYPGQYIVGGKNDPALQQGNVPPNQEKGAQTPPQADPILGLTNNKKLNSKPDSPSPQTDPIELLTNKKVNSKEGSLSDPNSDVDSSAISKASRFDNSHHNSRSHSKLNGDNHASNFHHHSNHRDHYGSQSSEALSTHNSRSNANHGYNQVSDYSSSIGGSQFESSSISGGSDSSFSSMGDSIGGGSSFSSMGDSNGGGSSFSSMGDSIGGGSGISSFLETSSKKRTSAQMRKVQRQAFNNYFGSLDNCRVNGNLANCQLEPNVHKTYYGVNIEDCY